MLTIGIVAGEVSGDSLGADFMLAMRAILPAVRFVGVGGTAMERAGLDSVIEMNRLSVMGLTEVVRHLPDLLRAKNEILTAFANANIDIFVGIDAPDFNLRLGKILKEQGVFCVQYVSPSVWAWRENRIKTIKSATDLVLCLFPFELPVYDRHHHPAVCVGHPLIKTLVPVGRQVATDRLVALGVPSATFGGKVVCLMAGSRVSEIDKILPILLASFDKLNINFNDLSAIIPVAKAEHITQIHAIITAQYAHLAPRLHLVAPSDDEMVSQLAMQACDVVLLASGTATLESLLLHAPMVVVYQVNALTYEIAKRLLKTPYVALPNILSAHQNGTAIVPELIQYQANPTLIGANAKAILDDPSPQTTALTDLANALRQTATANPAEVVLTHYEQYKHSTIRL